MNQQREQQQNAIAAYEPELGERYGLDEYKWKALVDNIWPAAHTTESIAMALEYCKARNLDPFKKPVHIVPMWDAKLGRLRDTVWPGIGELRITANRTKQFAGCDECVFGPTERQAFKDGSGNQQASCGEVSFPQWAQMTVYKIVGGERVAFVGPKVFWAETFSGIKGVQVPNSMWQKRPFGQLEKCAEAAALRRAFPEEIGEVFTADEMEGKVFDIDSETATAETQSETKKTPDRPTYDPQRGAVFLERMEAAASKTKASSDLDFGYKDNIDEARSLLDAEGMKKFEAIFEDRKTEIGNVSDEDKQETFLADLESLAAACTTIVDLNSLESSSDEAIKELSGDNEGRADTILSDHRKRLAGDGSSDDAAPDTEDTSGDGDENE